VSELSIDEVIALVERALRAELLSTSWRRYGRRFLLSTRSPKSVKTSNSL
jgi:hypothetical protein